MEDAESPAGTAAEGARPALGKLPWSVKLLYGLGQISEGLKTGAFGVFLLFYYSQVLGLSATWTGLAVGIALVVDAITDPLAGSISDRFRSRFGRRHPFMYASIIPLATGFYFLFAPPAGLSDPQLFGWLLIFAILTRAAMTLFHVPHLSLGAELTRDYTERTTVVGVRYFFNTLGALLAVVVGFGIYFAATREFPQGQFNVDQYPSYALVLSITMALTIALSALGTQKHALTLYQPPMTWQRECGVLGQLWRELIEALSNYSFRWVFIGVLLVFLMVGVDISLNLYMNTFFWELTGEDNLKFFAAAPLGVMLGTLFTGILTDRFGKLAAVIWGVGGWIFCQCLPILLRIADLLPQNGAAELVAGLVALKFVQGLFVAQCLVSFGSMIADIVDEHELLTHRRQEGIFFAAVAFSSKCTTGLGNLFAGIALDVISWPTGAETRTAADVAPETIIQLGILFGPALALLGVVSLWCYSHYQIDRTRHAEICAELERRRGILANA